MPAWGGLTGAKSATWRVSVLNSRTPPALVVTAPHDTRPACRRPPTHAGRACKTHNGEMGTQRAPGPLRRSCNPCRTRAAAGIGYRGPAALGCYQDLTLSRQRTMVGGSVHHADLFVTERSARLAAGGQIMHGRPNPDTPDFPFRAMSTALLPIPPIVHI